MEKYKIFYDKWFFESELHKSGAVKAVVDLLTEKGLTYEKEGAVWYKNKEVLTQKLLKEGKSQKYIDNLELKDDVLIRRTATRHILQPTSHTTRTNLTVDSQLLLMFGEQTITVML